MKKIQLFLLTLLTFITYSFAQFIIPITDGTIYYVSSAKGNDAADGLTPKTALFTIQRAVDMCSGTNHDYIMLLSSPALYDDDAVAAASSDDGYNKRLANSAVYINKPYVHIIGMQHPWEYNVVLKPSAASSAGYMNLGASADYCSLENLTFSTTANPLVVFAAGASYNTIKGCAFHGGSMGVDADAGDCARTVVENCYFEENTTYGLTLHSTDGILRNLVFKDDTGDFDCALYITGAAPALIEQIFINGAGVSDAGITVNTVNDVVLFNVFISGCTDNMAVSGTNSTGVQNFTNPGGQGYGISAQDSTFVK